MTKLTRKLPFLLILVAAILGAIFLRDKISFEALAENRAALLLFRDEHFILASLGFIAVYVVIVALSLPGATIATLTGGFLFGMFPGGAYNVMGPALGRWRCFWPPAQALAQRPRQRCKPARGRLRGCRNRSRKTNGRHY